MCSIIPAVVENHLDALAYFPDGKLILGSSNLTGRYWNGSIWCFENVDDAPDVEKCLTGIETACGICDIICLNEKSIIVAMESGVMQIFQLNLDPPLFSSQFHSCEHDDAILSVSLNSTKNNIVSGGVDRCIKIWDLESWLTTATYRPAHAGVIWQVSCSTVEPHALLSCGDDNKILLFDLRQPKPASLIDCSPLKYEPTSILWKPQSSYEFVVGDESGHVCFKDIRKNGSLCDWQAHKRRIFRMAFSPNNSWLATCADDTDVCITDISEETPKLIYQDNSHDDFIRGIAWNLENYLITCGWDKNVKKHKPSEIDDAR